MKKALILMPFFGKWPDWMPLYFESCRRNICFDWLFFTDCPLPTNPPQNVKFRQIAFPEYLEQASDRLGVALTWGNNPYKLCDLRPAYGYLHRAELEGYTNFGYGDVDVIYGQLSRFITDESWESLCISTSDERLTGHFALFRNCDEAIYKFETIEGVRHLFTSHISHGLDEGDFGRKFITANRCIFKNQYSTPLSPRSRWTDGTWNFPTCWKWKDGSITNNLNIGREFMYLHFMYWKGSRWLGKPAAWEALEKTNYVREGHESHGFMISAQGFHELDMVEPRSALPR